jgi:hypothetical protein
MKITTKKLLGILFGWLNGASYEMMSWFMGIFGI